MSNQESNLSTRKVPFRTSVIKSTLLSEAQMREVIADILRSDGSRSTAVEISDKELADKLVQLKHLTPYQADQLLAGRTRLTLGAYIVTDWIGQGGMGQVFKAVHNMMGREVAVKVLPLNKSTPDAIANFRREIKTQAQLDHPNLVRAYDAGEDGNVHFLVVEYVPGTDLRRLVRTHGKLTVQQASNFIKQTAEGLQHAHDVNLIHRDIKPGNILVTPEGIAKLSDLGLAGFVNDAEDPRAGKTVGTADYLSPEQIRTPLNVTRACDIYSLGCTLYYAITGKVPFPGGTPKNKARRHLDETPWHPRRFNEEVSDEFVDLIGDMMEKVPSQRIQSAAEVAERLAPWAEDDNPVIHHEYDRERWTPAPVPSVEGDQDTEDPLDVGNQSSLSQQSGLSETSQGVLTVTEISDHRLPQPVPPPPPASITEQFASAGHLPKSDLSISLPWVFVISLMTSIIGALVGFIVGQLLKLNS